jgi:hypothetical protein
VILLQDPAEVIVLPDPSEVILLPDPEGVILLPDPGVAARGEAGGGSPNEVILLPDPASSGVQAGVDNPDEAALLLDPVLDERDGTVASRTERNGRILALLQQGRPAEPNYIFSVTVSIFLKLS